MRLGIDSFFLGPKSRGMGRFAQLLTSKIPDAVLLAETSVLARGGAKYFPLWEQFVLPFVSFKNRLDCVISPYNTAPVFLPGRTHRVVVVHDLIFMSEPWFGKSTFIQSVGRIYRKIFVPIAVKRADLIVTVSQYSRDLICSRFRLDPEKVFVLPNSYDAKFTSYTGEKRNNNVIFTVAGEAKSKNLSFLMDVFHVLSKENSELELVVAGVSEAGRGLFIEQASRLGLSDRVKILGRVSDEEMALNYRTCGVYVCASLVEGFGIPLLEAMASGARVCASRASSLPEVCGRAADYFSPVDTEDAADVIRAALGSPMDSIRRAAALERCDFYSVANFEARTQKLMIKLDEICQN